MLRVLITNDDGISASGLIELARRLSRRADLTIIAPESPRSAGSHSITLHKPLRLTDRPEVRDATGAGIALACSGTPADCVTLALQHVCREAPPHIVLSGINDGPNLGEDLIYSGTVAGAVEAAIHGVPGLAISLADTNKTTAEAAAGIVELILTRLLFHAASYPPPPYRFDRADSNPGNWRWGVQSKADAMQAQSWPAPGEWQPDGLFRTPCFNINIPDLAAEEVAGVRWTALGHREYKDVVVRETDPRGKYLYWIWGERVTPEQQADSDIRALAEGYVSVTPMSGDLLNRTDLPHYLRLFTATSGTQAES